MSRLFPRKFVRFCTIAACAAAVATGCQLDRRPINAPYTLLPEQYCSGDTLTAGFDYLGELSCPAGDDCSPYFPTLTLSSPTGSFATTSIRDYRGSVSFPASGDTVSAHFDINNDGGSVLIPTRNPDGSPGTPVGRTNVRDGDKTARRITGPFEIELTHEGLCAGNTPTHAPANVPGAPRVSPNAHLVGLCNRSGAPMEVTLSGSVPGAVYTQTLANGECIDPSMPGVPTGVDTSTVVSVRPLIADPAARCSAVGPNNPPAALRTVARIACR